MRSSSRSRGVYATLLIVGIILIDQVIKYVIKTGFSLHETVTVTDWFQLVFTENRGMAFGMSFVGTDLLALFRIVAIAFFCLVLRRLVKRRAPWGVITCVAMVIAGAAGNIIDNLFYGLIYTESLPYASPAHLVAWGEGYGKLLSGRVVDMFYFPLFEWPDWVPFVGGNTFFGAIFNFADASISCGAVALILFYYRYLSRSGAFSLTPRAKR